MTVYTITYFGVMLYYIMTCPYDENTSNTWGDAVIRGVVASVVAVFWPVTMLRWVVLDIKARHGG